MTLIDWLLIILLLLAFGSGLKMGFIYKLGSLIGIIVGIIMAGRYYDSIDVFFGGGAGGKVIAFIVIMTIVSNIIGLIFKIINKFFNIIAIIPGLKSINRLLGGVLSVVQRVAALSIVALFLSKFQSIAEIAKLFETSALIGFFVKIGNILSPLLPAAISQVQSLI